MAYIQSRKNLGQATEKIDCGRRSTARLSTAVHSSDLHRLQWASSAIGSRLEGSQRRLAIGGEASGLSAKVPSRRHVTAATSPRPSTSSTLPSPISTSPRKHIAFSCRGAPPQASRRMQSTCSMKYVREVEMGSWSILRLIMLCWLHCAREESLRRQGGC